MNLAILKKYFLKSMIDSSLKGQCKGLLKNALKEAFFKESEMPEEIFMIYTEYVSSGIIGIYTDWLACNNNISLDKLTEIASDAVTSGFEKLQKGYCQSRNLSDRKVYF